MLPILRLIPVGGVILAIAILVLALTPPSGVRAPMSLDMAPARGALIASAEHPEWRQIFVNAALRRAEELNQLRYLPDTPLQSEVEAVTAEPEPPQKAEELAGVPTGRSDAEHEDVTGTIVQSPDAVIPVEIGEASSTELPLTQQEEKPPVIRLPQRTDPPHESHNVAPEPPKPTTEPKAEPEPVKPAVEAKVQPEPETPAVETKKAEPAQEKPTVEAKKTEPELEKPAAEAKTVEPKPTRHRTRRVSRRTRHARTTAQTIQPAQFNFLAAFFASFQPQPVKPRR